MRDGGSALIPGILRPNLCLCKSVASETVFMAGPVLYYGLVAGAPCRT